MPNHRFHGAVQRPVSIPGKRSQPVCRRIPASHCVSKIEVQPLRPSHIWRLGMKPKIGPSITTAQSTKKNKIPIVRGEILLTEAEPFSAFYLAILQSGGKRLKIILFRYPSVSNHNHADEDCGRFAPTAPGEIQKSGPGRRSQALENFKELTQCSPRYGSPRLH
jgi:hypothetical protein